MLHILVYRRRPHYHQLEVISGVGAAVRVTGSIVEVLDHPWVYLGSPASVVIGIQVASAAAAR